MITKRGVQTASKRQLFVSRMSAFIATCKFMVNARSGEKSCLQFSILTGSGASGEGGHIVVIRRCATPTVYYGVQER